MMKMAEGTEEMTDVQSIYKRLGDNLSEKIFIDRLRYSDTQDFSCIERIVDRSLRHDRRWQMFCSLLKQKAACSELYIYGAGVWGNILYRETKDLIQWRAVIDSYPLGKTVGKLPIITLQEWNECDRRDAVIVISSYKNGQEMSVLLQNAGICQDRIVDAGAVIYQLTEGAIYFDLDVLSPQADGEVFVDAGCFDGDTTRNFFQWCGTKGYAYCFEPDGENVKQIRKNLSGFTGQYELAEKALWSGPGNLCFDARGNYASSVRAGGGMHEKPTVTAEALDDYMAGRRVTYIKMDVEGAENEVLKGAKDIISGLHPKLAVSIYHKTEDIRMLPGQILSYYPNYRFYLRHYSFSDYDTVLYAVPGGNT